MMEEILCYAALFAVEAVIAWLYFSYLFTAKRSRVFRLVSFSVAYALLFAVSRLENTTVNSISFLLANLILLQINYQSSAKSSLLHCSFLTFIMLMSEVVTALVIGLFGYEFAAYTYDFSVMVTLMVFSKFLYYVVSIIGARIFSPHKDAAGEPHMMAVFLSLPVISTVFAIAIIYIGITSGVTRGSSLTMFLAITVLLLVNLLFMVLYNQQQKMDREHMSLQLSLQRDQADKLYYEALQEQYDSQRILVHDIRNHLRVIDSFAAGNTPEKIPEYIASLDAALRPTEHVNLCDNPILNAQLIHFRKQCQGANVRFHCDIRSDCLEFMDSISVTALFSNLLSNAIESASESQEKEIELSVLKIFEQGIVVISLVNTCDQPPAADHSGGFRSRKKDSAYHGIGLKSIERVVKKYHGTRTMYYDSEAKAFHHVIQFNLEAASEA